MDTITLNSIYSSLLIKPCKCGSIVYCDSTTNSDICITFIICVSILLLTAMVLLYFRSVASKKMKNETTDEDKRFLDFCYEIAKSANKEDEIYKKACWKFLAEKHGVAIEENVSSPKEDKNAQQLAKNKQHFVDFCFEMAKSADSDDNQYWEILKRKYDEPNNDAKNQ